MKAGPPESREPATEQSVVPPPAWHPPVAPSSIGDEVEGAIAARMSGTHDVPETPEQVEAEQAAVWEDAQVTSPPWYRRTWLRVVVATAAVIGAAAVIHYPLYVTSECAIVPAARAYVRAPMSGVLAEILVEEGAPVKKGDVIAKLDDRQLVADRRKALAETARISAELERLRRGARVEEISQQRSVLAARHTAVAYAQKEVARRGAMVKDGVGSKRAYEEAELDLRIKQNAASEAGAALKLVEAGSRPEEITAHEAELAGARATLEHIEQQLADMVVIRAPMDGVVLTPKFRERLHERVEAGGLVAEIADTRTMRAEVFVAEREADSIEVGMPTVVKVESFPMHPFRGKVGFIAPAVETRDKLNVIRVEVQLDNAEHLLRQDMTGYGEVQCGDRSLLDLASRRLLRWIRVRFLI